MEIVAHSPQLEACTFLEKSVLLEVNEFLSYDGMTPVSEVYTNSQNERFSSL